MTSESKILHWKSEGLPGDSLTLENTVMIFNSSKNALMIDPNTQATEWLKKHLQVKGNVEMLN
jgi:dynein heavy chain 2, cytosolic